MAKQNSFVSENNDDTMGCIRLYYLVNLTNKNKQLVICLRLYDSELAQNFFIVPQAIILLYDITSNASFDSVIDYYNKSKNDKKNKDVKYILVGNKIDLIEEEDDDQNSKNEENKSQEKEINNEKNNELKNENPNNNEHDNSNSNENIKITNLNNKIDINKIKEKENFDIVKEISGLNGFYLEELLDEIASILYKSVIELERSSKEEQYQIEGDSNFIDSKYSIDNRQSYYDKEYKKEVTKINKSNNKRCCMFCNIF